MGAERFWRRVRKDAPVQAHVPEIGNCWEFTGYTKRDGYGYVRLDGVESSVHRLSWRLVHGSIPEGMKVLHKCDNRTCVRPEHLFLGDDKTNSDDKIAKKRHAWGMRNPASKLDDDRVRQLCAMRRSGEAIPALAAAFGVSVQTVNNVLRGRVWKHVERPAYVPRRSVAPGVKAARILEALRSGAVMTSGQLAQAAGVGAKAVMAPLARLRTTGLIRRVEGGYVLATESDASEPEAA